MMRFPEGEELLDGAAGEAGDGASLRPQARTKSAATAMRDNLIISPVKSKRAPTGAGARAIVSDRRKTTTESA